MKKILFALLFVSVIVSCKDEETGPGGPLYNTWKLTETLADPGDGSGKWTPAIGNRYIKFNTNGTVEGDALPEVAYFTIKDSVTLSVKFKSTETTPVPYRYKITNNNLQLNPPCIEPCGYRFIKE